MLSAKDARTMANEYRHQQSLIKSNEELKYLNTAITEAAKTGKFSYDAGFLEQITRDTLKESGYIINFYIGDSDNDWTTIAW